MKSGLRVLYNQNFATSAGKILEALAIDINLLRKKRLQQRCSFDLALPCAVADTLREKTKRLKNRGRFPFRKWIGRKKSAYQAVGAKPFNIFITVIWQIGSGCTSRWSWNSRGWVRLPTLILPETQTRWASSSISSAAPTPRGYLLVWSEPFEVSVQWGSPCFSSKHFEKRLIETHIPVKWFETILCGPIFSRKLWIV